MDDEQPGTDEPRDEPWWARPVIPGATQPDAGQPGATAPPPQAQPERPGAAGTGDPYAAPPAASSPPSPPPAGTGWTTQPLGAGWPQPPAAPTGYGPPGPPFAAPPAAAYGSAGYGSAGYGSAGYGSAGPSGSPPSESRRAGWTPLLAVAVVAALIGAGVGAGVVAATKKTTTSNTASSSGTPSATGSAAPSDQPTVNLPTGSVANVAAALLPSVVLITVTTNQSGDEGTGIILNSTGEILTNNHVVEDAAGGAGVIAVTINNGQTVKASIVGRDPTSDLAVIRASGVSGLHPATLGQDSSLTVGETVVAIGAPLGLSNTVTSGIVSSLNRPVCTQNCDGTSATATPTVLDAIQTDAAINPGNSGGPLVDLAGDVVGVNSAIASLSQDQFGSSQQSGSIGVGFAIPIDEAQRVIKQLETNGQATHAVLGVGVQDSVDQTLGTPTGARVESVTSGGPSDKAGIRVGDIVVKIGSRAIVDSDSLIAAVHAAVPDSTVSVTFQRSGQTHTVQVTLGSATSS